MKIICIWKNYSDKSGKIPENPVFYFKPETTLLLNNRPFYFPEYSNDIVCNLQLVIKINKAGKYIQQKFAHTYYDEIGLGICMIAKDILKKCIKEKNPFDTSYSFDGSSPLSTFINVNEIVDINNIEYFLKINDKKFNIFNPGKTVLYSFNKIISYISEYMMLKTGDIIFSGPVSKPLIINIGDKIEGFLNSNSLLKLNIK
jgi:acylpyruvate hydrolase